MSDVQEFWFVARTRKDQELTIRESLEKFGIEHFIPTHTVIRQLKYRKKRVEVPLIRNMVFIKATKEKAMALPNEYGLQIFYIRDYISHQTLVVPNKQMEDFMFVMDLAPDKVTFDDSDLKPGVKVQVVKGNLCGVEGEFAALANHAYVMIRIPQVLSVSVKIPKSYLRLL
ncbi:UpxY family transcription antiterminator [Bacteroides sp. 519]|uniref:UpxY family transcription antiterminator n=1 Tax=Bacteroides sp. 519 TaxID=2302937 RepID=UPI0013D75BBA|nr:UpxY family transcription antiterminator [Bacteroides sp. 519]NDV58976.1 UpxY family transcription antiterminator [Bacteroides sp. 519]